MSDFLQFSVLLVVILVAAKLTGYLSTLIHQPAVFGELLIGVLLGPSLINILHLPFVTSMKYVRFHLGTWRNRRLAVDVPGGS